MIATDTFTKFARRMASTQGCPYLIIAETPNPIRQLEPEALRARAEAMIDTVIEGLTLPPAEIERRLKDVAAQQIHPEGVVRSAVPV
ncbi:MAG: hypothetical protein A3I62_03730 [Betaproteobacteria bacterium RIFCSPLOWO2_02_FULL_62_79]|nr:MAG: hypothetical protein A3I62_03730 [Betaproteobacteria bacterium RIFCSPLOWO2_02_FULL_62_79]